MISPNIPNFYMLVNSTIYFKYGDVNKKETDVSNILIYIFIEMNPIIHYLGF